MIILYIGWYGYLTCHDNNQMSIVTGVLRDSLRIYVRHFLSDLVNNTMTKLASVIMLQSRVATGRHRQLTPSLWFFFIGALYYWWIIQYVIYNQMKWIIMTDVVFCPGCSILNTEAMWQTCGMNLSACTSHSLLYSCMRKNVFNKWVLDGTVGGVQQSLAVSMEQGRRYGGALGASATPFGLSLKNDPKV